MTPEHRRRCWSHNVASAQGNQCGTGRDAVGRLFAAALDGDRRAEAALHLLGVGLTACSFLAWAAWDANRVRGRRRNGYRVR